MTEDRTVSIASPSWAEGLHRKSAERRVPLAAMLELTSRCNLRCVHCYLGPQEVQQQARAAEMTTGEVCGVIDQLADAGCLYLTITGGDPMMRRDFVDVYRHARERGLLVSVFCDGILVHERVLDVFRELPPRRVEISLYGATAETYERVTRVTGSFAGAMRGIRQLMDHGIRVGLKTVLMTINQHELEAMEQFAARLGVPFRFDGAIFPCLPDASTAPLAVRVSAEDLVRAEMADPQRRAAWVRAYRHAQREPATDRVYTCGAGQNTLYVDPAGNLSPCLMTTHHRVSLREKTLRQGWDEDLATVREKRYSSTDAAIPAELRGACAHCPGVNRLETGSETQSSPFAIDVARARRRVMAVALAPQERPMQETEHGR